MSCDCLLEKTRPINHTCFLMQFRLYVGGPSPAVGFLGILANKVYLFKTAFKNFSL